LRAFSNYFSSFLTTSFEIVDQPGRIRVSPCGCYCPVCSRLAAAPHLRTKRISKADRDGARRRRIKRVGMLAAEEGIAIQREQVEEIATKPEYRRAAAYSAYGFSLLERIRGDDGDPGILALWREIAWMPEGSPIKGFVLEAEAIIASEQQLVACLCQRV